MYVHLEIIGAAHVAVNINGGCTDACANVARAWQALYALNVTEQPSNSRPHSRHLYNPVPHGVALARCMAWAHNAPCSTFHLVHARYQ